MKNKLVTKVRNYIGSIMVFMLVTSQLQAHPGHEHKHDFVYMISHSLSHSGLFLISAVLIAAVIFTIRKIRVKK